MVRGATFSSFVTGLWYVVPFSVVLFGMVAACDVTVKNFIRMQYAVSCSLFGLAWSQRVERTATLATPTARTSATRAAVSPTPSTATPP